MSRPKSFRIQQDDKFFSRLLSKESSMANSSSRFLYYAVNHPSSVPFLWESKPGTRKPSIIFDRDHDHDDRDHRDHGHDGHFHVPALTPPPYYTKQKLDNDSNNNDRFDYHRRRDNRHKRSRSSGLSSSIFLRKLKIIANFGLKLRSRQWISSSSEGSGSVIDSATFRSCSTTTTSWFSSSALSFDSRENDDEEEEDEDNNDDTNDGECSNSRTCFGCYRG